jgi:multicomponent Na+:H+ antiporter subunit E
VTALRLSGTLAWLTVLWVLLWSDLSVGSIVAGAIVAVGILLFARLPLLRRTSDDVVRINPWRTLHFVGYMLVKLVESNLVVAWEIITPGNRMHTGILAVPLRTESETATMVVANVITLTPGSLVIENKGSPAVLYLHVMYLHDVERVRADLLRIEELSVRAFGSRSARRQLERSLA